MFMQVYMFCNICCRVNVLLKDEYVGVWKEAIVLYLNTLFLHFPGETEVNRDNSVSVTLTPKHIFYFLLFYFIFLNISFNSFCFYLLLSILFVFTFRKWKPEMSVLTVGWYSSMGAIVRAATWHGFLF